METFLILDRYYKMSEIPELGPKRGKDVPGSKAVVLIAGKYFKETRRYRCIDGCVIRRCTGIVSNTTYSDHKKRKRLNMIKQGKRFVDPGRQQVLYTYTPLTQEEIADVYEKVRAKKRHLDEIDIWIHQDGPYHSKRRKETKAKESRLR